MQLWGSAGAAMAKTTILGFGSLLSEQSSRLTFPDLENFRLVRVPNYRRLMQHPASIFFQRGIADPQKKNWCSLSAEPHVIRPVSCALSAWCSTCNRTV